ncbi:ABC transporter substrate-binding protein [Humibacter sp. RRB41]|uniref:ABC transporter substrate-binding protein n=1 Tax=Humibacter sp. RRB41 TaxID=2919946 RepID=UPI001FAA64E1|nr:ABC transporter substrate-binding protein [Humibacter sp. RRB41]
MKRREFLALAGVGALASVTLSSCSLISGTTPKATSAGGAFPKTWKKPITIDVFDDLANYQGIQTGWFAKLVQDKFNMKLNVIAPNVAGGGETLFNTRAAAGELGDLVVLGSSQHLDESLKGGLLLDAASYYKNMSNVKKYDTAVTFTNKGKKGTFAFPTSVSALKPTQSSESTEPTFGPYLRWDLYKEAGFPEINTLEDLVPVLQDMQKSAPKAPNGKPVYGLSLFKDWDGNMMNNAKQPACYYGFDEMGFVLAAADGSSYESIVDSDSHYVRSLRFFSKASQAGLVDPDSPTQNYSTMFAKYQTGQVLFAFWPWLAQPAYNTTANMQEGRGFEIAPLKDMKIFSYGAEVYGNSNYSLGIGAKASDPERVAAFLDWLYSVDGVYANGSQTGSAAGPKDLTWTLASSKKPELNAFGQDAFLGGSTKQVPADWGTGTFTKGVSALNVTTVTAVDVDPSTGYSFAYQMWPSYEKLIANPLTKSWSSHMGGAGTTMEYLRDHKKIIVAPGSGYVAPVDDSETQTLRNQIKTIIVQDSWKMAMATSTSQFNSLLKDMQNTVNGLGYKKVLKVDMEHAKAQNATRLTVAKKFG